MAQTHIVNLFIISFNLAVLFVFFPVCTFLLGAAVDYVALHSADVFGKAVVLGVRTPQTAASRWI